VAATEEEALRQENAALRRAITLLHRIANLSRESLELEPMAYAILTGVTAGVGLGLNRAMMFLVEPGGPDGPMRLRGAAAVGPIDQAEAHRVWTSIAAEQRDLQVLYEEGLQRRAEEGALDRLVRTVEIDPADASCVARAWSQQRLVSCNDTETGEFVDAQTGIASPMRGRSGVHGVLYADNRFTRETIDAVTQMVFSLVADHAGRAIENARRYEDVARAARTDALTGLGHHGALMEALQAAVRDAARLEEPLSLAMIDCDDFKRINDTYGHPTGDRVLAGVAGRLRADARAGAVYRYGGEEFAVLLAGANANDALAAAERLRDAISATPFAISDDVTIEMTCSIGVATAQTDARRQSHASAEALLQQADQALLRAKAAGKNTVVSS
jgi:diguanylate cyclase (GGDEF)-like protein